MVRSLENSELARSIGLDDIPVIITDPMVIISALPIPLIARPAITTHRLQAIPLFFFFFFWSVVMGLVVSSDHWDLRDQTPDTKEGIGYQQQWFPAIYIT